MVTPSRSANICSPWTIWADALRYCFFLLIDQRQLLVAHVRIMFTGRTGKVNSGCCEFLLSKANARLQIAKQFPFSKLITSSLNPLPFTVAWRLSWKLTQPDSNSSTCVPAKKVLQVYNFPTFFLENLQSGWSLWWVWRMNPFDSRLQKKSIQRLFKASRFVGGLSKRQPVRIDSVIPSRCGWPRRVRRRTRSWWARTGWASTRRATRAARPTRASTRGWWRWSWSRSRARRSSSDAACAPPPSSRRPVCRSRCRWSLQKRTATIKNRSAIKPSPSATGPRLYRRKRYVTGSLGDQSSDRSPLRATLWLQLFSNGFSFGKKNSVRLEKSDICLWVPIPSRDTQKNEKKYVILIGRLDYQ